MSIDDLSYVRMAGMEIRARLFPDPKANGAIPTPLPVAFEYQPSEDDPPVEFVFVPERSIQRADDQMPKDVAVGAVRVIRDRREVFYTDLSSLGGEPVVLDGEPDEATLALLRAVAGNPENGQGRAVAPQPAIPDPIVETMEPEAKRLAFWKRAR